MSKFSMKDYDEYLKEEARQDQLQESLESKRDAQTFYNEFDGDWKMYLEEHRHDTKDDSNQYYDDCDYELLEAMALADFSEDPFDGWPELDDHWYYPETTEKDAFIEAEYLRSNEMRRLYHAEKAATQKANWVKTETA